MFTSFWQRGLAVAGTVFVIGITACRRLVLLVSRGRPYSHAKYLHPCALCSAAGEVITLLAFHLGVATVLLFLLRLKFLIRGNSANKLEQHNWHCKFYVQLYQKKHNVTEGDVVAADDNVVSCKPYSFRSVISGSINVAESRVSTVD